MESHIVNAIIIKLKSRFKTSDNIMAFVLGGVFFALTWIPLYFVWDANKNYYVYSFLVLSSIINGSIISFVCVKIYQSCSYFLSERIVSTIDMSTNHIRLKKEAKNYDQVKLFASQRGGLLLNSFAPPFLVYVASMSNAFSIFFSQHFFIYIGFFTMLIVLSLIVVQGSKVSISIIGCITIASSIFHLYFSERLMVTLYLLVTIYFTPYVMYGASKVEDFR